MDNRASAWSITINNPTESDYEELARARQKGWKIDGQLEKGAEGTPHLQLIARTPQVRFAAVKKAFSRAHIEPARNAAALANYVTKEATRAGQLPTGSDRYPSLSRYWEMIAVQLNHGHRDWTCDDKEAFHGIDSPDQQQATFYNEDTQAEMHRDPLKVLDDVTARLIGEGYHVEGIAANPSTRAAWKKWWAAICFRSIETVRQTDSVQVPPTNVSEEEYNQLNADDHARPQTASGVLEGYDGTCDSPQGESDASRSPD